MQTRQEQLMVILAQSQGWLKGRDLAALLGVSDRTIRSDMNKLKQAYPGAIQTHHHKGYRLVAQALEDSNQPSPLGLPQSQEERLHYILKLLLADSQPQTLKELSRDLYVSPQTLTMDLHQVGQLVGAYPDLDLQHDAKGWQLKGPEFQKRRLYRELLTSELQGDFLNLDKVLAIYEEFDMVWVAHYFQGLLKQADYQLRPASLPILLLHVGIAVQRMLAGQFLYHRQNLPPLVPKEEALARKFLQGVGKQYKCRIPASEAYSIGRLLEAYQAMHELASQVNYQGHPLDLTRLLQDLGQHLQDLVGLDFLSDADFKDRFHLHLQGLIERLHYQVELPNLFLQDMKRQYPLVFDLAVTVSTWLGARLGVVLSEAEIGLIAVHIGSSYSRLERPWKARAILLAPQHYPLMQSSIDRLKASFGHRLEILAQYDYVSEAQLLHQPVDLVISFMPLAQSLGLPTLQVSTFFNEEDELALVSLLNQVEQRQTAIQLALQLGDFLESRFFYQDLQASSPEQVLTLMAQDLAQAGYVTPDFLPSVLEREALSSTDFDYALAIPHPLQAHSHQSVLAIANLASPIEWGRYPVKLVILLALKDSDWAFTQVFFKWLGQCLAHPRQLKSLLAASSRDDFLAAIVGEFPHPSR